ncbi:hypothetical protein CDAR_46821 [Caerostris darwini]|uniref:Uncharacterized protein n=1 Tax=Caerostris darwini TaxID=1538125 RepID=A0AAV4SK33_9ARAC|nr:hypothetical protein CDAR_46821 [Caerostris darwini]
MEVWNCEFCKAYVTNFEVHYCSNFGNQQRQSSSSHPGSNSSNLVQDNDSRSALPMNYDAAMDFLFPGILQGEENQTESAYSLQPSEDNSAIINQNPPFCEAWNPNPDVNSTLPVAEPCVLPGFQQTFGRRNTASNQLTQYPNVPSQMQCSGIFHMDEIPSHFVSDSNESGNASNNQLSQYYDTSLGIPISAVQVAQYNPMDPIPPTDAVFPI